MIPGTCVIPRFHDYYWPVPRAVGNVVHSMGSPTHHTSGVFGLSSLIPVRELGLGVSSRSAHQRYELRDITPTTPLLYPPRYPLRTSGGTLRSLLPHTTFYLATVWNKQKLGWRERCETSEKLCQSCFLFVREDLAAWCSRVSRYFDDIASTVDVSNHHITNTNVDNGERHCISGTPFDTIELGRLGNDNAIKVDNWTDGAKVVVTLTGGPFWCDSWMKHICRFTCEKVFIYF